MEYTGYDNSCKLVLQASEHVSNVGCTHSKGENPYRTKLVHWRVKTDERNQVCTGESFNITFQFLRAQLAWRVTASFMGGLSMESGMCAHPIPPFCRAPSRQGLSPAWVLSLLVALPANMSSFMLVMGFKMERVVVVSATRPRVVTGTHNHLAHQNHINTLSPSLPPPIYTSTSCLNLSHTQIHQLQHFQHNTSGCTSPYFTYL